MGTDCRILKSMTNVNNVPMSTLEETEATREEFSTNGLSRSVSHQTHFNYGVVTKLLEVLKSKKKYWITLGKFIFNNISLETLL